MPQGKQAPALQKASPESFVKLELFAGSLRFRNERTDGSLDGL